jgi:hypothetical protein
MVERGSNGGELGQLLVNLVELVPRRLVPLSQVSNFPLKNIKHTKPKTKNLTCFGRVKLLAHRTNNGQSTNVTLSLAWAQIDALPAAARARAMLLVADVVVGDVGDVAVALVALVTDILAHFF